MNARIAKEVRPLLPVLLIAVGLMLVPVFFGRALAQISSDYVFSLPLVALVVGSALLASTSFGVEFGERTLTFMLSQPISRPRIWLEKYAVLLPAVGVLALVFPLVQVRIWPMASWIPYVRLVGAVSVVASLCSAPFWAGVARSTIGAIVLNFGTQFLTFVGFTFLGEWGDLPIKSETRVILSGVVYSAAFLLAGWWRFSRAQVFDGTSRSQVAGEAGTAFASILPWVQLRSQPAGKWLNLIRRELMLQRSTFLVAGALLVFVPALYLFDLTTSSPGVLSWLQIFRLLPFALCVPGVALLAGPAAFCEENSLGTQIWSLTQPVSARAQFLVKLGVSLAVVAGLGVILPGSLYWMYHESFPARFADTDLNPAALFWGALWTLPVLIFSVRIATLFTTTIRAVLATIGIGVIGFLGCGIVMTSLITPYRLDAPELERSSAFWPFAAGWTPLGPLPPLAAWGVILLLAVLFLHATLGNFRHPVSRGNRSLQLVWCALLPAVGLSAYMSAEILAERSWYTQASTYWQFESKLARAIGALKPELPTSQGTTTEFKYTLAQLQAAGVLDQVDLSRFRSPEQQILARFLPYADPRRGPTLLVSFNPAISFAENTYPSYHEVRGLRINNFKRTAP